MVRNRSRCRQCCAGNYSLANGARSLSTTVMPRRWCDTIGVGVKMGERRVLASEPTFIPETESDNPHVSFSKPACALGGSAGAELKICCDVVIEYLL